MSTIILGCRFGNHRANLFENAKSYAAAAERLLAANTLDDSLAPALYLLIGHSLELSTKALCLNAGATEKNLKQFGANGHDLHEAYIWAMNKHKVPHYCTPIGQLILAINDHHKNGTFRFTPDVPELLCPHQIIASVFSMSTLPPLNHN
jgi:hypothetical protein